MISIESIAILDNRVLIHDERSTLSIGIGALVRPTWSLAAWKLPVGAIEWLFMESIDLIETMRFL
jgi:hypothetical protein